MRYIYIVMILLFLPLASAISIYESFPYQYDVGNWSKSAGYTGSYNTTTTYHDSPYGIVVNTDYQHPLIYNRANSTYPLANITFGGWVYHGNLVELILYEDINNYLRYDVGTTGANLDWKDSGTHKAFSGAFAGCTGITSGDNKWYYWYILINQTGTDKQIMNISLYNSSMVKICGWDNTTSISWLDLGVTLALGNAQGSNTAYNFDELFLNDSTLPPPPSTISYNVTTLQRPSDINSSTLNVTINAYVTNISGYNVTNSSSATLYYTPFTQINNGCAIFYQKSCYHNSSSYFIQSMIKINNTNFSAYVDDNELLPAYYPFNYNFIRTNSGYNYTAYNNNNVKFNIFNFTTNLNYTFLMVEMDAINDSSATASMIIYYCNSSYSTGNPLTSTNCEVIGTYLPQFWNHIDNHSRHGVLRFQINNVSKTQNSSIIFVSPNLLQINGWRFRYVLNSSYDNTSFNNGNFNSWSNTPNIYDIHLHQYLPNDYFKYYVSFNDGSNNTNVSETIADFYNVTYYPPTIPLILTCNQNYTIGFPESVFVNWTRASSPVNLSIYYELRYLGIMGYTLLCNTTDTFCYYGSNNITLPNTYPYSLLTCDGVSCSASDLSCSVDFCQNSYTTLTQPCVSGTRLKLYADANSCTHMVNVPVDNGTYTECVEIIYQQKVFAEDKWILLVLAFFLIVSLISAIFVHEAFFGLCSLLLGLGFVIFIYYDYPQILMFADAFMILMFIVMWIVIHKVRRG